MELSYDYRAFLAAEGVPCLPTGPTLENWDAMLEGFVQLGGSQGPMSWERFHRSISNLYSYSPFVEGDVVGVFD